MDYVASYLKVPKSSS